MGLAVGSVRGMGHGGTSLVYPLPHHLVWSGLGASCLGSMGLWQGEPEPPPPGGHLEEHMRTVAGAAGVVAAACLTAEPEGVEGPPSGGMPSTSAFPGSVQAEAAHGGQACACCVSRPLLTTGPRSRGGLQGWAPPPVLSVPLWS